MDHDSLQAAAAGAQVLLVATLTVPAVTSLATRTKLFRPRGYHTASGFYDDNDGEATEQSTLEYSDRPSRVAAWVSSAVGLAASIAAGVLAQRAGSSHYPAPAVFRFLSLWADVLAWAFISFQTITLPSRGAYKAKYRHANYALVSAVLVFASLLYRSQLHIFLQASRQTAQRAQGACWILQTIAALAAFFAFGTVPRRPDVYFDGTIVDQQYTVSLLSKLSFSWNPFLFDVAKQRQLETEDLPALDQLTRAANLHHRFLAKNTQGRLWWKLLKFSWVQLAQQWALVLVSAVLAMFPQYVMYNLLQRLEQPIQTPERGNGELATTLEWALGLCLSLALNDVVSGLLSWWTNSRLVVPVGAMLQTLVFDKALREHEAALPPPREDKQDDSKKDGEDAKSSKKPEKLAQVRQSVINHMKLDSGRVTMFCSFNYYIPLAVVKLVLAGGFLMKLLGWKAVVAGLGSTLFVIPLNTFISKKYANIQFGLMKYRDGKAHLLTEALQGMRQIKYSALEQHWENKILKSRDEELAQYWKASLFMVFTILTVNMGPLLLSCVAQGVYAWEQGGNIKASVIFASLGLFDQLDEVTAFLPLLQVYMMEAWTSCVRLEKYFNQPDKEPVAVPGEAIVFENATVAWPKKEEANQEDSGAAAAEAIETRSTLRDVSLRFPDGQLSIITGKTGSGKSLLLAAILGEVRLVSGLIRVPPPPPEEAITGQQKPIPESEWILPSLPAFVSQTPWIEAGTVQENILFGLSLVPDRYTRVLRACSLEKDLELLADGDKTEVGPKGVTLSGGQRWRVALARALYSRAGILVLDDVLSAVDAHVGRSMVDMALTGELAEGRTRILATHHAELCLGQAGYLVRLHEGRVESAEVLVPSPVAAASGSNGSKRSSSLVRESLAGEEDERMSSEDTTVVELGTSGTATPQRRQQQKQQQQQQQSTAETTNKSRGDEEKRETGRVKWKVYKAYLKASRTPLLWVVVFAFVFLGCGAVIGRVWSFKKLSEQAETGTEAQRVFSTSYYGMTIQDPLLLKTMTTTMTTANNGDQSSQARSAMFWIGMSVVFYLLAVLASVGRAITMTAVGLGTSRILFERMTHAILRAPLGWIDTNPSGRILNRFTSDMFMVDRRLPGDLGNFIQSLFQLLITIAASLSVSGYVLIAGAVLMVVYARVASVYIALAREVKRLNSTSHSPIFDQFGSVLAGLSTVRAFQRSEFYMERIFTLIDNANRASWALYLSGRWMGFRLSMLGTVFVTVVAVVAVSGHVDAALAGFSLTFALRYSSRLSGLLQSMTSIELSFNATERVIEYADIETEPQDGKDAPAAWPTEGRIEVEDLSVAYKDSLPPVLKHLNFAAEPGQRIGIVGRTGAGKSTLASVFFRLLKPRTGAVRIDGIDIADLKLTHLRSRLAIIPQDPFLFSGSLRSNLDMEGTRDDYEIQTTLQRVHLAKQPDNPMSSKQQTLVSTSTTEAAAPEPPSAHQGPSTPLVDLPEVEAPLLTTAVDVPATTEPSDTDIFNNLALEIAAGGGNLSQGQRQLVCLARALLARPKIVVMDEATSAVDRATDAAIQASLRDAFAAQGCTVLVIAHRLSTVADFDRILVLERGRVAEWGTPRELLERGMARGDRVNDDDKVDDDHNKDNKDTQEELDGTGAFWELVQRSAEKDKLVEMILGEKDGKSE